MDQEALVSQFPAATADAPPPPAANASPATAVPPPSHPSYAEMITAAILWGSSQGKEGGSSKRAIAKYIDRVYTDLPPSHSALLTHHLKRLKNSGHLVMIKNSYQLSSAVPIPPPSPRSAAPPPLAVSPAPPSAVAAAGSSPQPANPSARRGPGRPPKQKPATATSTQPTPVSSNPVVDNGSGFGSESGKKRRGRPPKQQQPQQGDVAAEVPFVQPISEIPPKLVNGEATSVGQKKRGRPPKQSQVPAAPPVVPFAQPVVQLSEEVVTADVPKRRPGRPPKANVVGSETPAVNLVGSDMSTGGVTIARSRGRPRKDALGPVSRPVGKKPRGRPRKLGGPVGMRMGMIEGKRRGRPPKGIGGFGPPKVRRRTGRPVGRPRKDASTLRYQTSDRERIANEELTTKFQLIQLKIREAVAIIRPCVSHENAALMALQELEELATVNLTAASTEEAAPPSPTAMQQRMNAPPTPAVPLNVVAPGSSPQPTVTETAPFTGAPGPFDVIGPPMNVSAPFHAPAGMESERPNPMSWFQSNEADS